MPKVDRADAALFNESSVRAIAGPLTYAATSWTHSWETDITRGRCDREMPTRACCCTTCAACMQRVREGRCHAANLAKESPSC